MVKAMSTETSPISVVPTQVTLEGGGFQIRRAFPVAGLSYFDPILLIDEMGPVTYGPGEAIGAPDHPHRGFETVTYIIDGAMEHEDSHGAPPAPAGSTRRCPQPTFCATAGACTVSRFGSICRRRRNSRRPGIKNTQAQACRSSRDPEPGRV